MPLTGFINAEREGDLRAAITAGAVLTDAAGPVSVLSSPQSALRSAVLPQHPREWSRPDPADQTQDLDSPPEANFAAAVSARRTAPASSAARIAW